MPPMSSLRTFISALRSGDTLTTRALNNVLAQRTGADELVGVLKKRNGFNAPLTSPLRDAIRRAPLPDETITECIDRWPDDQKERARRAIVKAVDAGRSVRFTWGLTESTECETMIDASGTGAVTIRALSPRSSLRIYDEDKINVAPVRASRARAAAKHA